MINCNDLLAPGVIVLAALGLQSGMVGADLCRLTSDKSARILTAWHLLRTDALEPVTPLRHFNGWTIYGVKPTLLPPRLLSGATSQAIHLAHQAG